MIEQLEFSHFKAGSATDLAPRQNTWKTCLRTLVFGEKLPGGRYYKGTEAYQFLLEVVCGLHSPMTGETEIMAQFKKFIDEKPFVLTPKISHRIIKDAKELRTRFLKGYGGQSYGSYCLNSSMNKDKIVFIGAGALVQEILPVIKRFKGETLIQCRHPEKHLDLRKRYPDLTMEVLGQEMAAHHNALVVIAAPIEGHKLEAFLLKNFINPSVLDMRSEQDGSSLNLPEEVSYKNLSQIFSEIEQTQQKLKSLADKIKIEILLKSKTWEKQTQIRPFGWEDLCY